MIHRFNTYIARKPRLPLLTGMLMMCAILSFAKNIVFTSYGMNDGLSENYIVSIIQLQNGRIAAVTLHSIDMFDNGRFLSIRRDSASVQELNGYRGGFRVYEDADSNIWIKDYGHVWCLDKHLTPFKPDMPDGVNDVFVDDDGQIYFVSQNTDEQILDIKVLDGYRYEFMSTGKVYCIDITTDSLIYSSVTPSLDRPTSSSLVVLDRHSKKFYQILDARFCLEFNPSTRQWSEIFRSEFLHTISLTNSDLAYITSRDGIWRIDLSNRRLEHIEQIQLDDGSFISSSRINTIFCNQTGDIWLGTYDRGILKGYNLPESHESATLYVIICILALCIVSVYILRLKKNVDKDAITKHCHSSETAKHQGQQPITRNRDIKSAHDEYSNLIEKAEKLVRQNLTTSGYTVERLAQDLCMDRTGLYRKMTSAINQSPVTFIRNIKVNHAVMLIKEGKLDLKEIAEQSGFSSVNYMSRCIQENLGKKISEIR